MGVPLCYHDTGCLWRTLSTARRYAGSAFVTVEAKAYEPYEHKLVQHGKVTFPEWTNSSYTQIRTNMCHYVNPNAELHKIQKSKEGGILEKMLLIPTVKYQGLLPYQDSALVTRFRNVKRITWRGRDSTN